MGLTERHWFENEDVPENYEWALEDAVSIQDEAYRKGYHKGYSDGTKEQEPITPIFVENPYTHLPVSYCPQCREPINEYIVGNPYKMTKFCHYCGKAVKWGE